MDIQHIMDYLPTTYALRLIGQKVCVKTLITLVDRKSVV